MLILNFQVIRYRSSIIVTPGNKIRTRKGGKRYLLLDRFTGYAEDGLVAVKNRFELNTIAFHSIADIPVILCLVGCNGRFSGYDYLASSVSKSTPTSFLQDFQVLPWKFVRQSVFIRHFFITACHAVTRKKHRVHLLHGAIDRPIEVLFKKRRLCQRIESNP